MGRCAPERPWTYSLKANPNARDRRNDSQGGRPPFSLALQELDVGSSGLPGLRGPETRVSCISKRRGVESISIKLGSGPAARVAGEVRVRVVITRDSGWRVLQKIRHRLMDAGDALSQ